jgi:hypothetical protein
LVEHLVCNQRVAGSNPVTSTKCYAGLAQLVERNFAKVKVVSSNLISRSKYYTAIVYRLGHQVFILGSGVRFPVAVPSITEDWQSGRLRQS